MTRIHFAGSDLSQSRNRLAVAMGVTGDDSAYPELSAHAKARGWVASSIEEADLVVHALQHRKNAETAATAATARERQLPCLFFRPNDDPTRVELPWGWIYRASIYRSRLHACEKAMPGLVGDLMAEVGGADPRDRDPKPSVAFCGYVGSKWNRWFYRATGRKEKVIGLILRDRALATMERSDRVACHFIQRTQFNAGEVSDVDPREEFLDNLLGANYALALRGMGNYSFRFYEIFSLGRIPLFVNTDCALPFEDRIDWKRHCVWVEEADLGRLDEVLADFHASHSADDLRQLQADNRQIWLDWLCPEAFYDHMIEDALSATHDPTGAPLRARRAD